MAAVRADGVRQPHRTAVRAGHQIVAEQRIVGAPAVAATLRVLALGMGGHDFLLYTRWTGRNPSTENPFKPEDYSGIKQ